MGKTAARLRQSGNPSSGSKFARAPLDAVSTCLGCQFTYLQKWGLAKTRRSPRERTHHHGGDRLARDVGHLDPKLVTKRSLEKPSAKIPAAAPSLG